MSSTRTLQTLLTAAPLNNPFVFKDMPQRQSYRYLKSEGKKWLVRESKIFKGLLSLDYLNPKFDEKNPAHTEQYQTIRFHMNQEKKWIQWSTDTSPSDILDADSDNMIQYHFGTMSTFVRNCLEQFGYDLSDGASPETLHSPQTEMRFNATKLVSPIKPSKRKQDGDPIPSPVRASGGSAKKSKFQYSSAEVKNSAESNDSPVTTPKSPRFLAPPTTPKQGTTPTPSPRRSPRGLSKPS